MMDNTINGRTPEEIKRGLECFDCDECSYSRKNNDGEARCKEVEIDALALINQLQEDKKQLERERDEARNDLDTINYANTELHSAYEAMKRERDAAVKQLRKGGRACNTCKFSEDTPENDKICEECRLTGTKLLYSNWEWVGPQEVE